MRVVFAGEGYSTMSWEAKGGCREAVRFTVRRTNHSCARVVGVGKYTRVNLAIVGRRTLCLSDWPQSGAVRSVRRLRNLTASKPGEHKIAKKYFFVLREGSKRFRGQVQASWSSSVGGPKNPTLKMTGVPVCRMGVWNAQV